MHAAVRRHSWVAHTLAGQVCLIGSLVPVFLWRDDAGSRLNCASMQTFVQEAQTDRFISAVDATNAARLIARLYTHAPTYAERSAFLLNELLKLFQIKIVTIGLLRPTRDTPRGVASVEVVEGGHAGEMTETEQAAMLQYFADINRHPDPAHTMLCEMLLRDPSLCGAFAHHQLVDDDGEAWCTHRDAVRTPGNVGAELFLVTPTATPSLVGSVTLHRASRDPLFSPGDIALAGLIAQSLTPLFDIRLSERRTHAVIEQLTPRMRDTLVGILRGGSEKTIASDLQLSKHTVHEYMKRLHVAFGVSTRTELLAQVLRLGITPETILLAAAPKPLLVGETARKALRKRSAPTTKRGRTRKRAVD